MAGKVAVGQRHRLGVQQGVMNLFGLGFSSQPAGARWRWAVTAGLAVGGAALAEARALRGARAWDEALLHRQDGGALW